MKFQALNIKRHWTPAFAGAIGFEANRSFRGDGACTPLSLGNPSAFGAASLLHEALPVGIVGEHYPAVLHHPHDDLRAAECLVGHLVGRVPLVERLLATSAITPFTGVLQVLQRLLDLVRVCALGLLHRRGEDEAPHRIPGRRTPAKECDSRYRPCDTPSMKSLALGRDGLLDEGLRHQGAVAVLAGVVDEVRHGQWPAADQRHLEADFVHAVGNGGQFRADAPDQDRLRPGRLRPQQLCGHVLVADVELLHGDDLQLVALRLDLVQQVVAAGDTVVGGVIIPQIREFDTHFLEFDFNRVKSDGHLSHLLVTVNDVTKRVMLARELQESQEKAQAQLDMLMRILHVDPNSLTTFLTDAETSLKMVNTILREPAREEAAFRTKIDSIYRQIHAVKGESSALGLKTVEQRAHSFEEALNEIKGRNNISGSDFLPLVVKLDDLFNHLAQVREMLGRLVDLHQAIASRRATEPQGASRTEVDREEMGDWLASPASEDPREGTSALEALVTGAGMARTLDKLAQKVADNYAKQVELECVGLDSVPNVYRRTVKDIAIQLVRNAVVHGIEAPVERRRSQKTEFGQLSIEFADRGAQGVELTVKDDGCGLQLDRIKRVAIDRGLLSEAQAALMDQRQTMALIFRPGFSTSDNVTTDAGRGAGMDLVRSLVAERNGRVGMATAKGRYTKFKIWLPSASQAAAA